MTTHSGNAEAFCPLIQMMRNDTSNNNTQANLAVVCIHGLFSCLGILENALVIWVLGFRLRSQTVASIWVLNLAMSDFLATLTLPLFTVYLYSSHSWELGVPLCVVQTSIFFLNMFISAFLLAAISLDRLLLVVKPVWSQNHRSVEGAWKVCALGWLWAALNTVPYSLFRTVIEKNDGRRLCYHHFAMHVSSGAALDRECNMRQGATAVSKLLLAFLCPLVVIAGSYVKIGLSLRDRSRRRKQSNSHLTNTLIMLNTEEKKTLKSLNHLSSFKSKLNNLSPTTLSPSNPSQQLSQSFTKMVTSVIATFILCWAPYHIFCMMELAAHAKPGVFKLVEVGLPLAASFAFLNPVLNPILYVFSCPHFCVRIRQSLGAVFDGLVEERVGTGKSLRAHMRRRSSRDVSLAMPSSPLGSTSPCQSPHPPEPSPLPSSDCQMMQTANLHASQNS